jgi:hypothetical protein
MELSFFLKKISLHIALNDNLTLWIGLHYFLLAYHSLIKISWYWVNSRFCKKKKSICFLRKIKNDGIKIKSSVKWQLFVFKKNYVSAFRLRILSKIIFDLFSLKIIRFGSRFHFIHILVVSRFKREEKKSLNYEEKEGRGWLFKLHSQK